MTVTDDYLDIEAAAKFMVQDFWEKATTTLSRPV
jgi:hypothetical protein